MVCNLTSWDQSRNARAARICAGMIICGDRRLRVTPQSSLTGCFHWFKQWLHLIFGATMQGSIVSHPGSSATRNGGRPETWSAAHLANLQAIATTMFCPRRLAAARETKAVEIKLVTSNGRNLVVTIVVAGECGLSLVFFERCSG